MESARSCESMHLSLCRCEEVILSIHVYDCRWVDDNDLVCLEGNVLK